VIGPEIEDSAKDRFLLLRHLFSAEAPAEAITISLFIVTRLCGVEDDEEDDDDRAFALALFLAVSVAVAAAAAAAAAEVEAFLLVLSGAVGEIEAEVVCARPDCGLALCQVK
jgi:hypothetical protein